MEKKIAFITGAAKGIGAKTAKEFSRNGYDVIIHYNKSRKKAISLKKELEKEYCNNIYLVKGDLAKEKDIKVISNQIKTITNHLDVLVNNAALSLDCEFSDKTKKDFINVLDVNLVAPFLLIRALFKMLDYSVIINISSTDAIDTGSIYNIDYSASKAGLITLTNILATSIKNVRFYSLAPNWVQTESVLEMNEDFLKAELKRVGQSGLIMPEDVAKKIISIVNDKELKSGSLIRMDDFYE